MSPRKRRLDVGFILCGLTLAAACASNPALDPRRDTTPSPKTVYEVFADSGPVMVNHLRISRDTLFGVGAPGSSNASTEVRISTQSVDSVKRVSRGGLGLTAAALPFAIAIGLMLVFRAGYGSD